MTYAYDDYVQMPTKDLYDTAVMKMAIEAAKDMYDKGLALMENFYKTYGDFMSPLARDMQWYGEKMNNVRNTINDAYARGIDLFKSPEGRAIVAQLSHSVDPMQFNMMRQSAENAKTFLKAKAELQALGLYNPLLAQYDEPSLSDYSTIESGVWGKMSPTPFLNMSTFGNPYFEGMKPSVRSEVKDGVNYSVEEITYDDLRRVADAHHNELVNTPQGQLMYKYYQDVARANGSVDPEGDARKMFDDAVADGQLRRMYRKDDFDDKYYKAEDLKLKRSANDLAWKKYEWDKQKEQQEIDIKAAKAAGDTGGAGTSLTGMPLAQMWYDKGIANSLSAGGKTVTWNEVHNNYGYYSKEIYDQAAKFGQKASGITDKKETKEPTNEDLLNTNYAKRFPEQLKRAINTPENERSKAQQDHINRAKLELGTNKGVSKGIVPTSEVKDKFKSQYTITMDASLVAKAIGDNVSGNDRVVQASIANVEKLFGTNDVITGTAGYTRAHEGDDTSKMRDAIKKYGAKNTRITPMGDGYASLRKTGKFEVMPRVHVLVVDDNGQVQYDEDAYYNIGVSGQGNKQGAYIGDNRKVRMHGPDLSAMKAQLEELQKKERMYANIYSPNQNGLYSPSKRSPEIQKKLDETRVLIERLKNAMTIYDEKFVDEHYEGDHSLYPDYDNWFLLGDWARHDISLMK